MIKGNQNICSAFNIFHDGCISNYEYFENNLELEIEVMYLAEMVNPDYRKFWLTLQNISRLALETWPKDRNADPEFISSPTKIFEPELEILSCEVVGSSLRIDCNQASPNWNYCGGTLSLQTDGIIVRDEGGKEYSIEDLDTICREYWSEWRKKNS